MSDVKRILITREELVEKATKALENAMSYLAVGERTNAWSCYGEAMVHQEMLDDLFGIDLEEEGTDHYKAMLDLMYEDVEKNGR